MTNAQEFACWCTNIQSLWDEIYNFLLSWINKQWRVYPFRDFFFSRIYGFMLEKLCFLPLHCYKSQRTYILR